MSQQAPTSFNTNGPSLDYNNSGFKEGQPLPDMTTPSYTVNTTSGQQIRQPQPPPPLQRADSRNYLQQRPPQLGAIRPNQPPPLIRPNQQQIFRTPVGSPVGVRPSGQPPFPQQQQQIRPPQNFIRPQQIIGPPRPSIRPQNSVPLLINSSPEQLPRAQTFDSTPHVDEPQQREKAYIATMMNRSYSVSSNPSSAESQPHGGSVNDEERRRSISNIVGSLDERRPPSSENIDKIEAEPQQSSSRPSSRMDKIMENDDSKYKEHLTNHNNFNKQFSNTNTTNNNDKKVVPPHLDLKKEKPAPPKKEGDNDSGVDESTQGNDQSSNGDHSSSPRKSSAKTIPSRTTSATPTKNRSLSRGSKSPNSLKSPDSTATTPGAVEKKKLPMNKVQVGAAPSPNLKTVKSKIGSLENASYKPGGGKVKIESKKVEFKNAGSRIEAKNDKYAPKGGDKKIQQQKLQWNAKSKIGSLENTTHKPKGGDKKIETVKLDFKEKAKPKVGSKDNMKHVPGGGDIKIENRKIDLKVQSKIGSLDNVKYKPGGGDKKIFDDKEYLKQMSAISSENHSLSGSQKQASSNSDEEDIIIVKEQSGRRPTLETVQEELAATTSRPKSAAGRLVRSASLRTKRCDTPRMPWRY